MSLTPITITGQIVRADGSGFSGKLKITPSESFYSEDDNIVIVNEPVYAVVDANGQLKTSTEAESPDIILYATEDTDTDSESGRDLVYKFSLMDDRDKIIKEGSFSLSISPTTQNLEDLISLVA